MSKKPIYIKSASDLITSTASTNRGFLLQAIQKIEKSDPYIQRALQFRNELIKCKSIDDLLKLDAFKDDLLTSVGFSTKAMQHVESKEIDDLLKKTLEIILKKHGKNFHDEILFRYFLIKGDALGGEMRNLTGSLGQKILLKAILDALKEKHIAPVTTTSKNGKIQSLSWDKRYVVFDRSPKCVNKNVDVIMLDRSFSKSEAGLIENKKAYLACGELKGGIDPAGADEHWKTARSSLERIRECFDESSCLALFFVAAAIEKAMAIEIYEKLESGYLSFAANLTVPRQVRDLAEWLISL